MPLTDYKSDLKFYLHSARDAMLWKLEGLSEYDMRRPLTSTGTNLLGLVKHLAACEVGYFGDAFGRPFPEETEWTNPDSDLNSDMWATADESSDSIIELYRRVCAHSDDTIDLFDVDYEAYVAHWSKHRHVTLHRLLVHMIAETHRHAGHADIVRELIDDSAGLQVGNDNMASNDATWWAEYRSKVQAAADHWRGDAENRPV